MTDCSSGSALRSQSIWMEQQALDKVSTCVLITLHTAVVCEHIFGPSEEENVLFVPVRPSKHLPCFLPADTQLYTGRFNFEDQLVVSVHWADTQMQGCHLQVDFPFTKYICDLLCEDAPYVAIHATNQTSVRDAGRYGSLKTVIHFYFTSLSFIYLVS